MMTLLSNLKTLLIDDDEGIRNALTCFFRVQGYPLKTFDTAEAVIAGHHIEDDDIFLCA